MPSRSMAATGEDGLPMQSGKNRFISFAEVMFATGLILAHEFLGLRHDFWVLVIVALVSFRVRGGSWAAVGFVRPTSWPRTIVIAGLGAAALQIGTVYAVYPLGEMLGLGFSGNAMMGSNMKYIVRSFIATWTVLSFAQQFVYFRYVLERFADIFGNTRSGYWIAALYVAILFSVSHLYLGY